MSGMVTNLVRRASRCPVASILKVLLGIGFIYALHVAAYHQGDMSTHSYAFLVDSVALLAALTLAFHWVCAYRHPAEEDEED